MNSRMKCRLHRHLAMLTEQRGDASVSLYRHVRPSWPEAGSHNPAFAIFGMSVCILLLELKPISLAQSDVTRAPHHVHVTPTQKSTKDAFHTPRNKRKMAQ